MIHKLKLKPKTIKLKKTKTENWFCDICGKNYTKLGKYQHLKTEMHKRTVIYIIYHHHRLEDLKRKKIMLKIN